MIPYLIKNKHNGKFIDINKFSKVIICVYVFFVIACHAKSSFDVAFSGTVSSTYLHSDDLLGEFLNIIKPNGYLLLREAQGNVLIYYYHVALCRNFLEFFML